MTRLEALADAIKTYEGWFPFSRAWRNNNPGNLRFSRFQTGRRGGFAYFASYATGWLALWYDLWAKCTGNTRTGLGPRSTLLDLCRVWAPEANGNDPTAYATFIAKRLNVYITTPLKWFLEDIGNF